MNCRVWAPLAKSVELVTPTQRIALHSAVEANAADRRAGAPTSAIAPGSASPPENASGRGYWQAGVEASVLEHGYRYSIDGGEPLPDPRSIGKPDGGHGESSGVYGRD